MLEFQLKCVQERSDFFFFFFLYFEFLVCHFRRFISPLELHILKTMQLILYNVCALLDAKCNLLGYRRHHSICYTRLFTTPLVVVTVSLIQ
jgi:hypothetical protein